MGGGINKIFTISKNIGNTLMHISPKFTTVITIKLLLFLLACTFGLMICNLEFLGVQLCTTLSLTSQRWLFLITATNTYEIRLCMTFSTIKMLKFSYKKIKVLIYEISIFTQVNIRNPTLWLVQYDVTSFIFTYRWI